MLNGTITPGSHLQKQKKSSKSNQVKQQDLDNLYKELESEMKSILSDMHVSALGELPGPACGGGGRAGSVDEGGETLLPLNDERLMPHSEASEEGTQTETQGKEYDAEVDEIMLNEEEQRKKKELWEAANGEWLKQQEEKRKQREASGKQVTKRKKKPAVGIERESEA